MAKFFWKKNQKKPAQSAMNAGSTVKFEDNSWEAARQDEINKKKVKDLLRNTPCKCGHLKAQHYLSHVYDRAKEMNNACTLCIPKANIFYENATLCPWFEFENEEIENIARQVF